MKKLYMLTGNAGKFEEVQQFLQTDSLEVVQVNFDLEEIQDLNAQKIIRHKAHEALMRGSRNVLLEDTSLYLNGMGRLPGPLIKWFLKELDNDGIYKLSSSMGNGNAYVETIFAYAVDYDQISYFSGKTHGKIVSPRGAHGFGWSSIFMPDGCDKTYGEMNYHDKMQFNQRIKALRDFKIFLENEINPDSSSE